MDKPEAEAKTGTGKGGKPLLVAAVVAAMLVAGVALLLEYLVPPKFIISWPELSLQESEATVRFTAINRTDQVLNIPVRISILDKKEKRSHGLKLHESLGEQYETLQLEPRREQKYVYTFPLTTGRAPTLAMVEQVKEPAASSAP